MNGSSSGDASRKLRSGVGKIIRSAISNRMIPPATARADVSTWKSSMNAFPPNRKISITTRAISSSRTTILRLRSGAVCRSAARKSGTLPSGSMISTKTAADETTSSTMAKVAQVAQPLPGEVE